MSAPRLSICIPTYNFGQFISETLVSILSQIQPGVEVVVLDSGSTDETPIIVRRLQEQYGNLRYERGADRGGIDRDMAKVVDLARGDYCWLFSADDLMVDGALIKILSEVEECHDMYICMHSNDSLRMQTIDPSHPVIALSDDTTFDLTNPRQQLSYFQLAETTEAFFSFISGLIVRRAAWNSTELNELFVGTCWAHVARIFELTKSGLTLKFLATVLVRRRADNDSFSTQGVVRRYALAIQGYQKLGAYFWGSNSEQAFHIRRVLRNEFRLRAFLAAKALCATNGHSNDKILLDALMAQTYCDRSLSSALKLFGYYIIPVKMYLGARYIYRRFRRKSGNS